MGSTVFTSVYKVENPLMAQCGMSQQKLIASLNLICVKLFIYDMICSELFKLFTGILTANHPQKHSKS